MTTEWNWHTFPDICAVDDGSWLFTYRQGDTHHSPGRVVLRRSTDNGRSWKLPHAIFTNALGDCRDSRLINLGDGRVLIAYPIQGPAPDLDTPDVLVHISTDNGETFGDPISLAAVSAFNFKIATGGTFVQMDDGAILLPVWGRLEEGSPNTCRLVRSTDAGATWADFGYVSNFQEGSLVRGLQPNSVICFSRDSNRLTSDDGGATWTAQPNAQLEIGNYFIPVRSSVTGNLLSCVRGANSYTNRPHMVTSSDEGATWTSYLPCAERDAVQEGASMLEMSPGVFYLVMGVGGKMYATIVREL